MKDGEIIKQAKNTKRSVTANESTSKQILHRSL